MARGSESKAGPDAPPRGRAIGLCAGALLLAASTTGCAGGPAEPPAPVAFDSGGASCAQSASADRRLDRPIVLSAIEPALIDRAIRLYTNEARCAAGVAPLTPDPRLAEAARIHAEDMAGAGFVATVRPADPTKTLEHRYRLAGVGDYRQRGENQMRITLETPGVARVASQAPDCDFARAVGLVPTYRSVAKRLVDTWAQTEAHAAAMLEHKWTHMGAAIAVRPVEGTCGDVYAAQSFKAL